MRYIMLIFSLIMINGCTTKLNEKSYAVVKEKIQDNFEFTYEVEWDSPYFTEVLLTTTSTMFITSQNDLYNIGDTIRISK